MGSLSNYAEDALLNHIFNTAYTSVATVYLALCTADPGETGSPLNECTATAQGYARQAIPFTNPAAARKVIQSANITFAQATGAWGTITHWAIMDHITATTNMLAYGAFTASFAPVNGNTPTVPSGEIQVQMLPTHYTATTIAVTNATTITDSANGFPLWPSGSILYLSGFTAGQSGNNGVALTVNTSAAGTITFTGSSLVTGAAGASIRVSLSGGFSDYAVHSLFNRMFRNQVFAKPATYVGLATAVIDDSHVAFANLTEVSGGNYARVQVNPSSGSSPKWTPITAGTGALDNADAIPFNTPSASWGNVTSSFVIDSASGTGNVLCYDNESVTNQTPVSGDSVLFPIGTHDVSLQ